MTIPRLLSNGNRINIRHKQTSTAILVPQSGFPITLHRSFSFDHIVAA